MNRRATAAALVYRILSASPIRWTTVLVDTAIRRGLWVWGHLRLAARITKRGKRCVCHWNAELKYPERIELGERVVIGINVVLGAAGGIRLDSHVRLSRDVMIETALLDFKASVAPYSHIHRPIHLEEGVWVGARAVILGGVTIGQGAVVAAGAVVNKDVPAFTVVAGVPAKVVMRIAHA